MTRLCRDRNETVAALAVVLVPGVVPAASTNDGAIAAKIRIQAEASAIVALRRNCIHASRPKCPLLRIGNRSPSNAAASRPIQSLCSNGAAHCAVATRRHRQPSQAKRLSGNAEERARVRLHAGVQLPRKTSVCLFSSTRCAAASDGCVCERENPKARFTRSAPGRSGRTDWPDAPGRCCPGCRPSRTGAPCAC